MKVRTVFPVNMLLRNKWNRSRMGLLSRGSVTDYCICSECFHRQLYMKNAPAVKIEPKTDTTNGVNGRSENFQEEK